MADEMTLEDLATRISDISDRMDRKFDDIRVELRAEMREQGDSLRAEMREQGRSLRAAIDDLRTHMDVRFEETHGMIRLGLETQEALRESTERRFAEADRKHDAQLGLLRDVLVHVRKRADRLESRRRDR